jgi:hypothetical protein
MLHVRVVSPPDVTTRLIGYLTADDGVINLIAGQRTTGSRRAGSTETMSPLATRRQRCGNDPVSLHDAGRRNGIAVNSGM